MKQCRALSVPALIMILCVAMVCGQPPSLPVAGAAVLTEAGDSARPAADPRLSANARSRMRLVPAGIYRPLYTGKVAQPEPVSAFLLDAYQVTDAEFAEFAKKNPEWNIGRPPAIKAGPAYLTHWRGGQNVAQGRLPARNVSWFAARAFCKSIGKRLPTIAEWERAAMAPDRARPNEGETALVTRVLEWYGKPNNILPVGSIYENTFGIHDLHGSVWEWTEDFNSVTIDPDGRAKGKSDRFCGGGGFNASNPRDYAAFMRQAFRGGLTASSTTNNLGFRCAADL